MIIGRDPIGRQALTHSGGNAVNKTLTGVAAVAAAGIISGAVSKALAGVSAVAVAGVLIASIAVPASVTDGNDTYTKVLLHGDGSNGGTTITDSNAGGSAHTWTAHGSAVTSTAQAKFGTASLSFPDAVDGTDYIDTPDSSDFTLGSSDFTADTWFYVGGGAGTQRHLCSHGNSPDASFWLAINGSNKITASATSDGSTQNVFIQSTTTITTTGWHHVAFVRTGSTFKLFLDGVQEGGDATYSGAIWNSASNFYIGRKSNSGFWNGYVDEFRLSVGTARWTSNFTPPTTAYGVSNFGVSATCSAGSMLASGSLSFTGVSAAGSAGTMFSAVANTLTGVSATSTAGSFTPQIYTGAIPGVSTAAQVGTISGGPGGQLVGVSCQPLAGVVTVDITGGGHSWFTPGRLKPESQKRKSPRPAWDKVKDPLVAAKPAEKPKGPPPLPPPDVREAHLQAAGAPPRLGGDLAAYANDTAAQIGDAQDAMDALDALAGIASNQSDDERDMLDALAAISALEQAT